MSERYEAVPNSLSDNGYDVRDTVAGAWVDELSELNRLAAEVAALRQRAEAASNRADMADAALAAEKALKRTAYAKLDATREVVEKTIIPALEGAQWSHFAEGGDMGFCPSCMRPEIREHDAHCAIGRALAAARKTLED